MSRRAHRHRCLTAAAALSVVLLAATGCGGGDSTREPRPEEAARQDGAASADDRRTVDQSAPGAAAVSYFEAVRDARFSDACAVLAPVVRNRYAATGKDCPTAPSQLFDETTRAAIGDVKVDEALVRLVGDTATVPGDALSRADLPAGAPEPAFPDVKATRQDGGWYLVL